MFKNKSTYEKISLILYLLCSLSMLLYVTTVIGTIHSMSRILIICFALMFFTFDIFRLIRYIIKKHKK